MRLLGLIAAGLVLAGCASQPDLATAPVAQPEALAAFGDDPPVVTAKDWTERRAPLLRQAFQEQIYGLMPNLPAAVVEARETLKLEEVGKATVEQWTVRLGEGQKALRYHLVMAFPAGKAKAPLIIAQLFCGLRSAIPERPESVWEDPAVVPEMCRNSTLDPVAKLILGKRINGPDIAEVTDHGYALALLYPAEVVPDEQEGAQAALSRIHPDQAYAVRGGALAAWAELFSRTLDAVGGDPRIDPARTAIWGHSRHGKAALLAAAFDPRFAAVISHQSGRGGASLTRSSVGESVAEITKTYGYWFGYAYRSQTGPVTLTIDQHQLIALIAPRPLFLGSGMSDAWSDPAGAFRAAQGADPVYELFGSPGLTVSDLTSFDPKAGIAFWTRGGGHGVTTADWKAFLEFLDHALKR